MASPVRTVMKFSRAPKAENGSVSGVEWCLVGSVWNSELLVGGFKRGNFRPTSDVGQDFEGG